MNEKNEKMDKFKIKKLIHFLIKIQNITCIKGLIK